MKIGVFSALYGDRSWEEACKAISEYGVKAVEAGSGGVIGKYHVHPQEFLKDRAKRKRFIHTAKKYGLEISALSAHGNPLHPDKEFSKAHSDDLKATTELASLMGIDVVNCFGGCPGAGEDAKYPNWITCPWPTYFGDAVKWQWEEKLVPFWKDMSKLAKDTGVKFALEMHPGDMIYNPELLLMLREEAGDHVSCNFDPSHLFWQGIDPILAIERLGPAIVHVHAKDSQVNRNVVSFRGVNDWKHYSRIPERAWTFRTVGYGHGSQFWNDFVSTLRVAGYNGVISIEHEDPLMSADEGLGKAVEFLKGVLLYEEPGAMWWA
jgi:sugar phosphate isomerase/epimerase